MVNWTPIRKGETYCSSACGYNCKHEAFVAASCHANILAEALGEGWKADVWENFGWHWQVVNGRLKIKRVTSDSYSATYDNEVWVYGKNPKQALKKLAAYYEKELAETNKKIQLIKDMGDLQ